MSNRKTRKYVPHALLAERYGPSSWWETPKPLTTEDLPGVARCFACGSQVPEDEPCRKCARAAAKRRTRGEVA